MGARIGVIGAGQVGAAAAYLLSGTAGVSDVVLVDVNTARAAGEAADIGHAAAFGNAARVSEGGYADLAGASVVVITAGASLQPGQTRLQLVQKNLGIADNVVEQVLRAAPDTVLLFATNPVDVMPALAVLRGGVPASRAIGTGCMLDSTRFRDRLAHHLQMAPGAVHAYVYGEHGDSQVLHWSSAVAGGVPILSFAEQLGRPIDAALQQTMAEDVRRGLPHQGGQGRLQLRHRRLHRASGARPGGRRAGRVPRVHLHARGAGRARHLRLAAPRAGRGRRVARLHAAAVGSRGRGAGRQCCRGRHHHPRGHGGAAAAHRLTHAHEKGLRAAGLRCGSAGHVRRPAARSAFYLALTTRTMSRQRLE